ncbi:MAG: tail assembly protein, partial [Marivivens sp.]|nr:tail assembly protein [Marivivens sp.]NCW69905.1 tail assembly protein [Marivivens sp.]NDH03711.1 tail assembly protein [Marivivens sp.]
MQQVVRLLGDLGERYGAEHTYYDLRTPADAIKLLCINSPAFLEELVYAHEHGVGYTVVQAGQFLGLDDLHLPLGKNDLVLTPVVVGSGGGGKAVAIGAVVLGVALIATAVVTGGTSLAFGLQGFALASGVKATTALGLAAAAGNIGLALTLGGVAMLLAPQPTIPKLGGVDIGGGGGARSGGLRGSGESSSTDGPQSVVRGTDGRQSYAYTGAANTVGVGATIPVAYGEVLIGSHLLSATVDVADESDP